MSSPSCYFRSINLRNIKSFGAEGEVLEFTNSQGELAQWTLLLGDNGVGKTTVLQCLVEACADTSKPLKIPHEDETLREVYVPRIAHRFSERNSYLRKGSKQAFIKVAFSTETRLGVTPQSRSQKTTPDSEFSFEASTSSFRIIEDDHIHLQPFAYGAFRRFGNTKLGAELNPDSCSTLFEDNEPLINVEEWLLRADYAATKSPDVRAKKRLAAIKSLLIKFLPEVEDIRIRANGVEVPKPEAKTPDGWVPVQALSTGYRATMAWITDFAARMLDRYSESEDPFSEPAVVLVDQIDTHLHPKWQRQLVNDLSTSFIATQFIVTAHSPLMVLAMPQANIAVFRREGDHVRICTQLEDVKGWRVDQIIASGLFEEQPTRDSETEANLEERRKLILQSKLSKTQQAKLSKLNDWATSIPTAEAPEDIRAMEIIRKASEKIEKTEQ